MFLFCVFAMLPGADPTSAVTSIAFADGGRQLFALAAAPDGRGEKGERWACVWDFAKPELKAVVTGLPKDAYTIHPTADGKRFVLVGSDRWYAQHVTVWDVAEKKKLRDFDLSEKGGGAATVSPDANWVAFRPNRDQGAPRVWNTATGNRAEELEKALGTGAAAAGFTPDSKRLVYLTDTTYTEYDLATGKAEKTWKREDRDRGDLERVYGRYGAVLPDGKGIVTVAPTGKRRQSYVINLRTEKKTWFLGETWDFATAPVLSPDGRQLIITGGRARDGGGTFALKLGGDGTPEMTDKKDEKLPFWGAVGEDGKRPAWREWAVVGEAKDDSPKRFGRGLPERESLGALAFSPDGKRVFAFGTPGRLRAYDAERLVPLATLYADRPTKDALPGWFIATTGTEFVASPTEAEALTKSGKKADPAKVRDALGVK